MTTRATTGPRLLAAVRAARKLHDSPETRLLGELMEVQARALNGALLTAREIARMDDDESSKPLGLKVADVLKSKDAVAQLSKEMRETMAEMRELAPAVAAGDSTDELRAARARRLREAQAKEVAAQ